MKKILFTPGIASIEALGSITRLISIGDEIKKRDKDCEMIFRSAGREGLYAENCGYKVVSGYKPKFNLQKQASHTYSIKGSSDVIRLKNMVSEEYIENTFKEEVELLKSFKPDIIVGEFELVMPIAAKVIGIPYFCTGGTPNKKDFSYFRFSNEPYDGCEVNYNKLLKSLNLPIIQSACELIQDYNASKVFVPSIPQLEDLGDDSKYVFLGSMIPENFIRSDFNFEKKRSLIYVYLSVGEIKPDVYQRVLLDTFEGTEFDVIVTGGGAPGFNDGLSEGNVHFMNMIPSDKVLNMADIAIHHGGQNTTVQCIENKVPSIIFPGNHFERYYNAEKSARIGCALNPGIESFNKDYLLKTCREIIKDNKFKENLDVYSKEIKNCGGTPKAAEVILNY